MNKCCCSLLLALLLCMPRLLEAQSVIKSGNSGADQATVKVSLDDFRYKASNYHAKSFIEPITQKPGLALVTSAILPGSGQAANGNWLRAGAYILAEAVLLTVHFNRLNDARSLERQYKQYAEENWSVVGYAQWLDNYYEQNGIAGSEALNSLRNQLEGVDPAYDHDVDWEVIDIETLREVERDTPFIYPDGSSSNNFSHTLPSYGSQQYFELISKYFQYGPGWRDFGTSRSGEPIDNVYQLSWDGSDLSSGFFQGSSLAERFNNNYRIAGNMVSLLVLNHIISAFDAFLTVKIKNNRLKAETNLLSPEMFSIKYRF